MYAYLNKDFIKKYCEGKNIHPSWLDFENPTPSVIEYWEERWKEIKREKRTALLWNPISNKKMSYDDMVGEFGPDLTQSCFESEGKYSKKLIAALHKCRPAKEVDVKFNQHNNSKIDGPFMGLEKDFIFNDVILKANPNKTMLYLYMRGKVWEYKSVADVTNIYDRFYAKYNILASTFSVKYLSDLFSVSEASIKRWLRQLSAEKAIIKYTVYNKTTNQNLPSVFIVGLVENGKNIFLYNKINDESIYNKIKDILNKIKEV